MRNLQEDPLKFTVGIDFEKLDKNDSINRVKIIENLINLFEENGVKIGNNDRELDQLRIAANKILSITRHFCLAADITYNGKEIFVIPNPIADILHKKPSKKVEKPEP